MSIEAVLPMIIGAIILFLVLFNIKNKVVQGLIAFGLFIYLLYRMGILQ